VSARLYQVDFEIRGRVFILSANGLPPTNADVAMHIRDELDANDHEPDADPPRVVKSLADVPEDARDSIPWTIERDDERTIRERAGEWEVSP
jgi:hypothetical protein